MQTMTASTVAAAEDVGNIVSMEHVNVRVPDQSVATLFYIVGLGFTRDPYMNVGLTNIWVNIGEQQIHLPTGAPQVVRGHTGLVVRDLNALKERLQAVERGLTGTQFAWSDRRDYVDVTSPWGNHYHCYGPGAYGSMQLGVPYVEFTVPMGSAAGIQRFYDQVLRAPASLEQGAAGAVTGVEVGTNQKLWFREAEHVPEYDGHHIAVYLLNFSGPYQFLEERNLVTEDIRNHQFRFKDIVDPANGTVVFTLEHEVRSSRHPGFRRPLVNREPENPAM
jgi:hypothetical protein